MTTVNDGPARAGGRHSTFDARAPRRNRMRGAVPMHKRLQLPALAAFALLSGCASLPATVERTPSTMLSMTQDTPLGGAIAAHLRGHPGLTGIQAISHGRDAFAGVRGGRMVVKARAHRQIARRGFGDVSVGIEIGRV